MPDFGILSNEEVQGMSHVAGHVDKEKQTMIYIQGVPGGNDIYRVSRGMIYTWYPGGNVPDFGITFLNLNYTDITQNTYIRS